MKYITLLPLIVALASAQLYYVPSLKPNLPEFMMHDFGEHSLLSNRNRLLVETNTACYFQGPRLQCDVSTRIDADDGSYADLNITVNCPVDSTQPTEFRKVGGCDCYALVTSSDTSRPPKYCPCAVCPFNFGDNPVSIDCTPYEDPAVVANATASLSQDYQQPIDPYVISSCTSMDCDFACNGTCRFDCVNSGPDCKFCEQPTPSPKGMEPGSPTDGSSEDNPMQNFGASRGIVGASLQYTAIAIAGLIILVL